LIESFINHTTYEVSGKYDSQAYADALYDKVNPLVMEYVAIEPHVLSEKLKIHGTADAIVRLKDKSELYCLDWKTGAHKSIAHAVQLAVYAYCWDKEPVTSGLIARVDKKSKKLTVHIDEYPNLSQYYPIVEALRTLWEFCNGDKNI